MSLLVVGVSHRTAPVPLLERCSVGAESLSAVLRACLTLPTVAEAVVLSTCNRTEVYAEVSRFHPSVADLSELLAGIAGIDLSELTPHLYVHYEQRAASHLFGVACGLDSMVVGESQILGQVKESLRAAQHAGTAGRVLDELFREALHVGKRAHAETDLDRAGASLLSVGLSLAADVIGDLAGRRALVVGAGSMSALAASSLRRAGAGEITVVNRTPQHGQRLAASVGGRYRPLAELGDVLGETDLLISCTGAVGTVVSAGAIERARQTTPCGPLFVLDLALPHDVEPEVRALTEVTLVDLERLSELLSDGQSATDITRVRAMVDEQTDTFSAWDRASCVAPTVVALRAMAEGLVQAELVRLAGRLPELDERSRDEVAQSVRRVVDKLLHAPTVRVKEFAGTPGAQDYTSALRALFDLGEVSVDTVPLDATDHDGALPDADRQDELAGRPR